jgi:hypothetical protein
LATGAAWRFATASLQVQCWRRLPGVTVWQPRCAPVELAVFIQRFLTGESL